jgi:hypothetical protein
VLLQPLGHLSNYVSSAAQTGRIAILQPDNCMSRTSEPQVFKEDKYFWFSWMAVSVAVGFGRWVIRDASVAGAHFCPA